MNRDFRYILKGNGCKAVPIISDMSCMEIEEYIRIKSKPLHKDSNDTIFYLGNMEFVNPKIMALDDFMNFCPYIIGGKK